tara:strand:+ start:3026 stop:4075 length:1050 start_codon:yes stop_codon:yes gene_type:complete
MNSRTVFLSRLFYPLLMVGAILNLPAEDSDSNVSILASSASSIKLGMTVSKARKAMGAASSSATFSRTSDGDGVALISVIQDGKELVSLYAGEYDAEAPIDENAIIEFIEVWSPTLKTGDGAHVGMSLSDTAKLYGGISQIMMSEIESREHVRFMNHPSGIAFRISHDSDTAGEYLDGQMATENYRSGAFIFGIGVSGPHIIQDGSIGGIRLDTPATQVLATAEKFGLGSVTKGEDIVWEAFGQAVQPWEFTEAGIEFEMISNDIGGPKSVFAFAVRAPCSLKTGRGIGIGDRKADVIAAYSDYPKDEEDFDGYFGEADVHLVGSIYGGMIFTFEEGKLVDIFLGAVAE